MCCSAARRAVYHEQRIEPPVGGLRLGVVNPCLRATMFNYAYLMGYTTELHNHQRPRPYTCVSNHLG